MSRSRLHVSFYVTYFFNSAPNPSSCEEDFKCANGACIFHLDVCNYVDNCGDGSDERNCGELLTVIKIYLDTIFTNVRKYRS